MDRCGSRADNDVRVHQGLPSHGRGGTTGPVEPGGANLSYDDVANAIFHTGYGDLDSQQRLEVNEKLFARNNLDQYRAYLDSLGVSTEIDPVQLAAELSGIADFNRCFGQGDVASCVWMVIGAIPVSKTLQVVKAVNRLGRAAEAGRVTRAFCSFSAETEVLMANGNTKPISRIQPGDQVLTTDPHTGEQSIQTVTAVWIHQDTLINLHVRQTQPSASGDTVETTTATISVTPDHPFWNHTDQQWQPAHTINPGDQLLAANGNHPTITASHQPDTTTSTPTAYNLTVTDLHTYHILAGDTPVLVHNTGPNCGIPTGGRIGDELGGQPFHGSEYTVDEYVQFVNGHTGHANSAIGRPTITQVETTLRGSGPTQLAGQNASVFELNGVRVIINWDKPWKSTAYFPGS